MAFIENLDAFFSDEDFAQEIIIRAGTDREVSVMGIFDNEYAEVGDMATTVPMVTLKTDDYEDPTVGDKFTIAGVQYTMREYHPDGMGVTMVRLQKRSS